jgi:hypothetical protein
MGAGLVAAVVGSENLRWLFVIDAVSCLSCALIVYLAVPADPPRAKGKHRDPVRGPSPWRDPALLAMTASTLTLVLARPLQRVSLSDQQAFAIGFLLMAAAWPDTPWRTHWVRSSHRPSH